MESPTASTRDEEEALRMLRRSLQGRDKGSGRGIGRLGLSGDKGLGATALWNTMCDMFLINPTSKLDKD